jgi:DNA-binding response OmpR family regulator
MKGQIQVLLVEDNAGDRRLVRDALCGQQLEINVHECSDVEQAIGYVQRIGVAAGTPAPDIVILDLNLPKGDGVDVLQAVRASPHTTHIPIVVMSSSDSDKDRVKATTAGGTLYFVKPFDLDEFMRLGTLVRDLLEEQQRSCLEAQDTVVKRDSAAD